MNCTSALEYAVLLLLLLLYTNGNFSLKSLFLLAFTYVFSLLTYYVLEGCQAVLTSKKLFFLSLIKHFQISLPTYYCLEGW